QQVGTRSLGGTAEPPPDVQFERKQVKRRLAKRPVLLVHEGLRQRQRAASRDAVGLNRRIRANGGELVRPCDAEAGARGFHVGHRIAQVIVLRQGGPNQALELLVLEYLPPLQVSQRGRLWRRERLRRAERAGHGHFGTLVIGSSRAAAENCRGGNQEHPSTLHISLPPRARAPGAEFRERAPWRRKPSQRRRKLQGSEKCRERWQPACLR